MRFLLLALATFAFVPHARAEIAISIDQPLTAEDLGFHKASIDVVLGNEEVLLLTQRDITGDYTLMQQQVTRPKDGKASKSMVVLNDKMWNGDAPTTKFQVRTPLGHRTIEVPKDAVYTIGQVGDHLVFIAGDRKVAIDVEVIPYAVAKARFPEIPANQDFWSFNLRSVEQRKE
jgi:hypothetical protein